MEHGTGYAGPRTFNLARVGATHSAREPGTSITLGSSCVPLSPVWGCPRPFLPACLPPPVRRCPPSPAPPPTWCRQCCRPLLRWVGGRGRAWGRRAGRGFWWRGEDWAASTAHSQGWAASMRSRSLQGELRLVRVCLPTIMQHRRARSRTLPYALLRSDAPPPHPPRCSHRCRA